MQPKVLVIGSRDHNRADCVNWLQPFPNIEEYDFIVINLQSLTQDVYDKIQMKIRGMREPITTVLNTNREIFCVMNKLIHPSPAPSLPGEPVYKSIRIGYVLPTNYDWLLIRVEISDRKKGTSTNVSNHRFDRYFQCVSEWKFELSQHVETWQEALSSLVYSIIPIAKNKSEKVIAGTVKCGKILGKLEEGSIHLLPPPTKCDTYQAIEILLDLICGEEVKIVPPWRKDIEVPKIKKFEQKINDKIEEIKRIQQEISTFRSQMQEWDSYRDLLTATGYKLETIIQKALADIGIKTKKTEKGFPVDLISNKVAIEITGIKGCVGVGSEKVIQTGRFKQSYRKREKTILIANTHMDISPKDRKGKVDFSPEVRKYFESLSVCCLTTMTLFQLWKEVMTGKKDPKDVKSKILKKDGELTLSDFE
jgi:hypothetical protein